MESSLNRILDFKLVFESLCEGNGMVRLEALTARWPNTQLLSTTDSKVPESCVRHWKSFADKDGFLDWDKFSSGLQVTIKEDSLRLRKDNEPELPQSEAEKRLSELLGKKKKPSHHELNSGHTMVPLSRVCAEDVELFLSTCSKDKLAKALTRLRKDLYKGQLSIHRLTKSSATGTIRNMNAQHEKTTRNPDMQSMKTEAAHNGNKSIGNVSREKESSHGIVSQEKESLVQGLELLERTKQWYSSRLGELSQEKSRDPAFSKKVTTEDLLVVLETGSSTRSEMLQHLKEINTHLESLASPAPGLTQEQEKKLQRQLKKLSEVRKKFRGQDTAKSLQDQHSQGIGRHTKELHHDEQEEIVVDTTVDSFIPTFPVYTAEELKKERQSQRSSSTMEVHHTGVNSQGTAQNRRREMSSQNQRYASSHNVSSRHPDIDLDCSKRTPPKRAHSFTSNGSPKFEMTYPMTDYPVSHPQREPGPVQYPLRETTSMQEIAGGRGTAASAKMGPHVNRPINPSSLKSSSVRNIPSSVSSYGNKSHGSMNPGIMHQQVYSGSLSYSTQTLPSSARQTEHYRVSHDAKRSGRQMQDSRTHDRKPKHRPPQTKNSTRVQSGGGQQHVEDNMLSLV